MAPRQRLFISSSAHRLRGGWFAESVWFPDLPLGLGRVGRILVWNNPKTLENQMLRELVALLPTLESYMIHKALALVIQSQVDSVCKLQQADFQSPPGGLEPVFWKERDCRVFDTSVTWAKQACYIFLIRKRTLPDIS
jgi:hypothetical protein